MHAPDEPGLSERTWRRLYVATFVYGLLTGVFNAAGTAPLAVEALLSAGSHDLGPKGRRVEEPKEWTPEKIREKAKALHPDKGPGGNFED